MPRKPSKSTSTTPATSPPSPTTTVTPAGQTKTPQPAPTGRTHPHERHVLEGSPRSRLRRDSDYWRALEWLCAQDDRADRTAAKRTSLQGRSYGTTVIGTAASTEGVEADNIVFVASTGAGVESAASLGVDESNVWATRNDLDSIGLAATPWRPL
ncbi:alpha/beta hydrolase [Glycomyces sp. YM15]|uniref:alpha/beta hydrolase n=1 Tax=Glycomyces sp. YM15 TaxID=2800446 RepID=UPI0035ABEEEB